MSDAPPTTITWTPEKLHRLKLAYAACVEDSFTFEGHVFLKTYAKYLIEYLEIVFGAGFPSKNVRPPRDH